jgi:hypothetical protein
MTGMEIALLIMGALVFVASFLVPEIKSGTTQKDTGLEEKKIQEIIEKQVKDAKDNLQNAVDETMSYAVEKSERSLERLSNEKITAVSEFSETVLEDIHKSHQEVMFLYDMLHDKQKNLRETVKEVDRTSAMARETKNELETAAKTIQGELVAEEFVPMSAEKISPAEDGGHMIEPTDMPVVNGTLDGTANSNEKILEMHKQGKSNVAIAKKLGLGVGEVNLVIDLFEVM